MAEPMAPIAGGSSLLSFWQSRRRKPEEVELTIVGAGICGLSTAYWWGQAGRRAVVLDAGPVAGRASGRNAGFLITGTPEPYAELVREGRERTARRLWEVSNENRELLRGELLDPGRVDAEFLAEGSWVVALADKPEQERQLRASAEAIVKLGVPLEWRERDEVRRASGSERFGAGFFQPRDGGIDPILLCRGLARLSGVQVRTGARVRALEPAGDRVLVTADGGDLLAERVLVATNAYAPALLPHLAGKIRPVRAQMLATGPGERTLLGSWYVNDGYEYFRQPGDGVLALGGCRWVARDLEVGLAETPTATIQAALERFLAEALPQFAGRAIVHRWAGIMAFTDDGLPLVGEIPEVPGALYAAGFNGHGMSLGFRTGRYLADRLLGREVGELF